MCGFLAEISPFLIKKQCFQALLDLSKQRGPDQQDLWTDEVNCQMGFNRLAILDLSDNGRQPLHSPSERYVLMLNGEIYNYKAIQKKFSIPEEHLRSGSDAEVIVQALDIVSILELMPQLDGMFALSVYDRETKTLTLGRDFAGIKPLYYGITQNTIVCASQFNQVFRHPSFREQLRLRAEILKEYMGLGYMQAPNTVFEKIYQLHPGEYLVYDAVNQRIADQNFYYQWKEDQRINEMDPLLPKQFNELFGKVVKSQLQSDVPLATFFSGGIDSPLVAVHANAAQAGIIAYSLKVDDPLLDESEVAAGYAEHLGIQQELLHLNEVDLLENVEAHFKNIPEPHGDYTSLPTWAICKQARQHAAVMLSGDGGDELFWGYPRFIRSLKHIHWFKYPRWIRKLLMPIPRRFDYSISQGPEMFETFGEWILYKQVHLIQVDKLIPNTNFSKELKKIYSYSNTNKQDALRWLKKNEFYAHMQRVLRKVDLMSMANSLEVRVPFLAKKVIEFSNAIDPELSIKHFEPKLILKQALLNFIPEKLLFKKKKGLNSPIEIWMRGPLRQDIQKTILSTKFFGSEYLNEAFLRNYIEDFYNQKHSNAWAIWHIYAWQKWAIENKLVDELKSK